MKTAKVYMKSGGQELILNDDELNRLMKQIHKDNNKPSLGNHFYISEDYYIIINIDDISCII
jgi:hypothetical protein